MKGSKYNDVNTRFESFIKKPYLIDFSIMRIHLFDKQGIYRTTKRIMFDAVINSHLRNIYLQGFSERT
jgi:hypothetical protein